MCFCANVLVWYTYTISLSWFIDPISLVTFFILVYQVINFSTGRIINKTVFDSEVTSMDHDHTGQLIFCGDARVWSSVIILYFHDLMSSHVLLPLLLEQYVQGCIYSVSMNSHTGALSRSHRHRSTRRQKSPITTVQYRSFSLLARGPVLLTCTQDGSLSFFRSLQLNICLKLSWPCLVAMKEWEWDSHYCPDPHMGQWYGDLSSVCWEMILPGFWCKIIPMDGHGILIPPPLEIRI